MRANSDLHPQLAADTFHVSELDLCLVLLMNNACYPWVILVPRQAGLREITDLTQEDQHLLMDEIAHVASRLQTLTGADKMNIAALGNMVPQLHIHVIARFKEDTAWPAPVWGKNGEPYTPERAAAMISALQNALDANN